MLAALIVPGVAHAAPVVVDDGMTVTEGAPRDGVIAGGDTLTIAEHVHNTGATTLTGVQATLTSSTPGVSIDQGTSTYPDIAPFDSEVNDTQFQIELDPSLPCGTVVSLSLEVTATGLDETIPLTVRTGGDGTSTLYSLGLATTIPNGTASLSLAGAGGPGVATTKIIVPSAGNAGTVSAIQVHLAHLHYPALGHLKITLVAPNLQEAVLLDHRGGSATDLDDVTFAAGGADPASASSFSSVTLRPEESLDPLLGANRAGSWKLHIDVDDRSESGTLSDWGIDLTTADCSSHAFARVTASPAVVPVGGHVTLDGSASVIPDVPLNYAFSASDATITGGGASAAGDAVFSRRGDHVVTLTATDHAGTPFTATTHVIVSDLPDAQISPGSVTADKNQSIPFDASASTDPEPADGQPSGIAAYAWSVDGGAFEAGTAAFSKSFASAGPHQVTVRVTDVDGATDTATAAITVVNHPPVAGIAVQAPPAVAGRATTLDATASHDTDGTIADYRWDLDGDGVYETDGGTTATRAVTFATHGAHSVGVQVVDDDGATDVATLAVHVTDAPVAGTIAAVPSQPRPGTTVGLTVSGATDPDGTIASYQWDFGDGIQTTTAIPSTSHLFATRALRTVTVRVVDNDGASSTATYSLSVAGLAPIAALTAAPSPAATGATVQFDASGSHDPDSLISDYKWDLDSNGSFELDSGTTPTAARSYPNPGLVTVRVKVTDEDGNSSTASVAVDVRGPVLPGGAGGSGGGGSAGGGAGSGSPSGGGGSDTAASLVASLSGKAIQTQKAVLSKGIAISCQTSKAATCALTVQVSGRDARRLGLAKSAKKPVVIARGTVRTTGAKARTATLKVTKKVAAKLKRVARVTILVVGDVRAGAAKTKVSRSILVRRQ